MPPPTHATPMELELPEIREPEITPDTVETSLRRNFSDLERSDASEWIVTDRGEALYLEVAQPYADGIDVNRPQSPSSHNVYFALMEAKCRGKMYPHMREGFFPKGELEKIITEKVVIEILQKELQEHHHSQTDIRSYAKRICHIPGPNSTELPYMKMFTILLLIKKPGRIVQFIKHHLSDRDLPLKLVPKDGSNNIFELRRQDNLNAPLPLDCFNSNDIITMGDFDSWQWATIAPFFAKGPKRRVWLYLLSEQDILPWVKKEPKTWPGGFSTVYHVTIHPYHHEFGDSDIGDGTFALKKLRNDDYDGAEGSESNSNGNTTSANTEDPNHYTRHDFKREVDVLRRFSGNTHPHLVSLLAAFQKGNNYYLLFHWAYSDLKNFWQSETPGSALDKGCISWMFEQFRGIAAGLQHIHHYKVSQHKQTSLKVSKDPIFGRHGDIKPENLLLFKRKNSPGDKGIIQLSDFGLAKFHSEDSRSGIRPSKLDGCSPTYRPPEVDFKDGEVSRDYDIWSLACVLLEFVTWHLGGWKELQNYVQQRKQKNLYGHQSDEFFEIVNITGPNQLGARVKPEVLKWIDDLHCHPNCSDPIHQLLDFIQSRMLVVLPNDKLSVQHRRAPCTEVYQTFNRIYNMLREPDYRIVATPRTRQQSVPEPVVVPVILNAEAEQKASMRISELRQYKRVPSQVRLSTIRNNSRTPETYMWEPQKSATWDR